MIHVPCWVPLDDAWKKWAGQGVTAREDLVRNFSPKKRAANPDLRPDISALYRERNAKKTLLSSFHNKCAYCESPLTMKECDVEHYRPKAGVAKMDYVFKGKTFRAQDEPHPGYYWLAYDWTNLLPSCIACNRLGDNYGKGNHFPVRNFRGYQPGQEAREEPLLLNPWWHCPDRHFDFSSTGVVGPVTVEGEACIKIFGLNRTPLVDGRKNAFVLAQGHVKTIFEAIRFLPGSKTVIQEQKAHIDAYMEGRKPYSAAGRAALFQMKKEFDEGSGGLVRLLAEYIESKEAECFCQSLFPLSQPVEDDL